MTAMVVILRRILPALLALVVAVESVFAAPTLVDSPKAVVDEAWQTVERYFADPAFDHARWRAEREKLLATNYRTPQEAYRAIRAALKGLGDPYTRFFDPREFENLTARTTGQLVGVGVLLSVVGEGRPPVIVQVLEGSPAERAGVKNRDELVAVDGRPTEGLDIDRLSALIRGEAGSRVTLAVRRGERRLEFALERGTVQLRVVRTALKEENGRKIGYLRLREFSSRAPEEMRQAIGQLVAGGAEGLVLDLRDNGGGVVGATVRIASYFLREGRVVQVERQKVREVLSVERKPLTALPLVVLVNQGSASAAEILAAALKENRRAVLVGTRTFGKGLIQRINPLADGSGINVTVARYLSPEGREIHKRGVDPDIPAMLPDPARRDFAVDRMATGPLDSQYRRAVEVLFSGRALVQTP